MRLRKNSALTEAIKEYADIVFLRGQTGSALLGKTGLEVEIGSGRGGFITALAAANKEKFFVGVESKTDVLYYAARKIRDSALSNVRLIEGDAAGLENWFSPGQAEAVYINFCDPWPKARHGKRRLVFRDFLYKYHNISVPGGRLYFKTDNRRLFAFALEEFAFCGLKIILQTLDLHNSGYENQTWTEYERKFHKLGLPVCFCAAVFCSAPEKTF
ncbi:MAG: tRNA (guanosine(46)-N7)-methyltransferase TrmB [Acidaminococcales bacterium]|jgi:tRNA (guanine-N7-)-methyltransferase|nr:tRNA (guanosine(46)-N7)-methyltransferase TrmB [Acidaminococcales bacterium]